MGGAGSGGLRQTISVARVGAGTAARAAGSLHKGSRARVPAPHIQWARAGLRNQARISVPCPFHRVRRKARASIERKITSNPTDAVRMLTLCLGRIETRPYTNSMWTQYTSREAWPS